MAILDLRSSDSRDSSASVPSSLQRLRSRAFLVLGGLAAFGLAACAPIESDGDSSTEVDVDQYTQPIIGGTMTTAYPSTGYVEVAGGSCTGTLIAQRAVLTAAHCVDNGNGGVIGTGAFWTQAADGSWTKRPFSSAHVHPSYFTGSWENNDVAVLILTTAVTTITPSPLGTGAPYVGLPITLVGYGYISNTGGNEDSNKYVGTNKVASFTNYLFSYNGNTPGNANNCSGDSGGPAFDKTGAVIGVTSTGIGNIYCSTSGTDVRVGPHASWILSKIPAGGGVSTSKCATVAEGSSTTLSCDGGRTIANLTFASYGNPTGMCGGFSNGSCNASTTKSKLESLCKGKASCVVAANNTTFGDPCASLQKSLKVQYTCQ